eukprot:TRINITY_DN2252_c0_g1_i3.p1 TRINITY_DN2252_c0_g1~~TRINITY_DN2252_c0_g1_i3.p1  ORF type:complete len:100 (+),score=9.79 TRINITY_DN2252_c0_g1_i3:135-434(+)
MCIRDRYQRRVREPSTPTMCGPNMRPPSRKPSTIVQDLESTRSSNKLLRRLCSEAQPTEGRALGECANFPNCDYSHAIASDGVAMLQLWGMISPDTQEA